MDMQNTSSRGPLWAGIKRPLIAVGLGIIAGIISMMIYDLRVPLIDATSRKPTVTIETLPPGLSHRSEPNVLAYPIAGHVKGLSDPHKHKLLVYVLTDRWWLQPIGGTGDTSICDDGRWSTKCDPGEQFAVMLVQAGYPPKRDILRDEFPSVDPKEGRNSGWLWQSRNAIAQGSILAPQHRLSSTTQTLGGLCFGAPEFVRHIDPAHGHEASARHS